MLSIYVYGMQALTISFQFLNSIHFNLSVQWLIDFKLHLYNNVIGDLLFHRKMRAKKSNKNVQNMPHISKSHSCLSPVWFHGGITALFPSQLSVSSSQNAFWQACALNTVKTLQSTNANHMSYPKIPRIPASKVT